MIMLNDFSATFQASSSNVRVGGNGIIGMSMYKWQMLTHSKGNKNMWPKAAGTSGKE